MTLGSLAHKIVKSYVQSFNTVTGLKGFHSPTKQNRA